MVHRQPQTRRIKCPYCGWERSISADVLVDSSLTDVVRGWGQALGAGVERIKKVLRDVELDEGNAKFDIKCSNCGRSYRFNVVTGAIEP